MSKRYPPSNYTMISKCTPNICGDRNSTLFYLVTNELLSYLNSPDLTAEKLFQDFRDAPESYYGPSPEGEWLSWKFAPGWFNLDAANALLEASPTSCNEIMQVPKIGPDTFLDMFYYTLFRVIRENGICMPIFKFPTFPKFIWFQYFGIKKMGSREVYYVKVKEGIPFNINDESLFIFPTAGRYSISMAFPNIPYHDPSRFYQASDLRLGNIFQKEVEVTVDKKIMIIKVNTNRISVKLGEGLHKKNWKIAIVKQKDQYTAKKMVPLYNTHGNICTWSSTTPCNKFAFKKQNDLEEFPKRSITKPSKPHSQINYFYDLDPDNYKILLYSDYHNIVIATVRNVKLTAESDFVAQLPHNFILDFDSIIPPPRAFLNGDIIRQYQQNTPDCGTFALALAMSYWDFFTYHPLRNNGKWMDDNHGDWVPGTKQDTMRIVSGRLGYSVCSALVPESAYRVDGLLVLKKWIACGIPVIINIDESQNEAAYTGAHYKVLIGYDTQTKLHHTRDDGTVGSKKGALYFANSGAKGRDEGDPTIKISGISNPRRENHDDFNFVPIGNDVDSYPAFWYKWRHGGLRAITKDLWYLPLYPRTYRCIKCDRRHFTTSNIGKSHWEYLDPEMI
ncbi:MAG: hypothetical protein ACTSO7_16360 [Candidatus Heimdallarchaeota archaeon]